jgi:hypothetical protein
MKLPFTIEQFLAVFKAYNQSVFPLQILFYLLALVIVFLSVKKMAASDTIINALLAFLWLWMGVVYHLLFFTAINQAAYLFGGLFIVQAVLFLYNGVIRKKLSYHFQPDGTGFLGATLLLYAVVIYPLLGYFAGHFYPALPTFGVPCPTTIFTFGILLWSRNKVQWWILLIPFLWSIIGVSAAVNLGIWEDTGLFLAGVVATGILLLRKNKFHYS